MGLFSFLKKSPAPVQTLPGPYPDSATNLIYNLLFCDNFELYREKTKSNDYPFNILFSKTVSVNDLQKVIDDSTTDPRIKMLAYNRQLAAGHKPVKKELLAVIVEVALDEGLSILASFNNGTARHINQTGKILIWETTTDDKVNALTKDLFSKSLEIVNRIGPWDKPRRPAPTKGNVRISFLVSDGLYFGEGSTDVLFSDQMAAPALSAATALLQYLTEVSSQQNK